MNYKKYQRIKIHKKLARVISNEIPNRKQTLRKLTTFISREVRNDLPLFYSPMDFSKNKPMQIS